MHRILNPRISHPRIFILGFRILNPRIQDSQSWDLKSWDSRIIKLITRWWSLVMEEGYQGGQELYEGSEMLDVICLCL